MHSCYHIRLVRWVCSGEPSASHPMMQQKVLKYPSSAIPIATSCIESSASIYHLLYLKSCLVFTLRSCPGGYQIENMFILMIFANFTLISTSSILFSCSLGSSFFLFESGIIFWSLTKRTTMFQEYSDFLILLKRTLRILEDNVKRPYAEQNQTFAI